MDTALHAPPLPRSAPRPIATLAVLAGHGLMLWALLQLAVVERIVQAAAPLVVRIVDAPAEQRPAVAPLPTPPREAPPSLPPLSAPAVVVEAAPPAPAVVAVAAAPAAVALPAPVAAPAAPVTAPATVAPPAPAAPLRVAASALRYRVEPPVVVPRLSRRLRESGTVLLHVVVDAQGLPRSVSLRQSSGFARLDEQALGAMRQARFVPCTADGRPVECESDAPVVYELEN